MRQSAPTVIAVDGRGTNGLLVLDGPKGRGDVIPGPANVATDFDAALAEIAAGRDALAARAGHTRDNLAAFPAYLGLTRDAGLTLETALRAATGTPARVTGLDAGQLTPGARNPVYGIDSTPNRCAPPN